MAWLLRWLKDAVRASAQLWRGVEAQHNISTMRLVDSAKEQLVLEQLLEASKPAVPVQARGMHYLLATPFRYLSGWPSRFRQPNEPGVWYGAEHVHTVCAELGYWRWRFLMDSDGLRETSVLPTFTLFQAQVQGVHIDLSQLPWSDHERLWMHPSDYGECHRLALKARQANVQWLRYRSARDQAHRHCAAVFDPAALSLRKPTAQQTWAAKIQADVVFFSHDADSLQFDPTVWADAPAAAT